MLADMRRDHFWEGKWVALGGSVGALPNVISALNDYRHENVIDLFDLAQIVLFAVALAVFVVLHFIVKDRLQIAKDLVAQIRERTRHDVAR